MEVGVVVVVAFVGGVVLIVIVKVGTVKILLVDLRDKMKTAVSGQEIG